MTVTRQLIELLQRERNALHSRNWDEIADISKKKSAFTEQLPTDMTQSEATQIEELATENERLLNIMHRAATSVRERLTGYSTRAESVAYVPDGERLKVEGTKQPKRV